MDISQGEFEEFELRGVPARLVRRDPETQVIVRLEKVQAMQKIWRDLDLAGTPWPIAFQNMSQWGLEDTVLVAPNAGRILVAGWLA